MTVSGRKGNNPVAEDRELWAYSIHDRLADHEVGSPVPRMQSPVPD